MPGSLEGNHHQLVSRMRTVVPALNRFRMTLKDWVELCEAYGIQVHQRPRRLVHGQCLRTARRSYIFINERLNLSDKIIAVGHEFTHLELHEPQVLCMSTGDLWNRSKYEFQCDVVGVLSLMPTPEIAGLTIDDLMRCFGVRREVAEFRASLFI